MEYHFNDIVINTNFIHSTRDKYRNFFDDS